MAVLDIPTRTKLWRGLLHWYSEQEHAVQQPFTGPNKFDLYNPATNTGMIADVDNWADTHGGNVCNTTGLNGVIQEPCKSAFNAQTKGFILAMIVLARFDPELVRNILTGAG